MGRVCDKHGEWCPDGQCRWCEPGVRALAAKIEHDNDLLRKLRGAVHEFSDRDVCAKCGMSGKALMQNPHIGCV